jgi:hypothetical protein
MPSALTPTGKAAKPPCASELRQEITFAFVAPFVAAVDIPRAHSSSCSLA